MRKAIFIYSNVMENLKRGLIILLVLFGFAVVFLASEIFDLNYKHKFKTQTGQCDFVQNLYLKKIGVEPIDYSDIRKIPNKKDQIKEVIEEASKWPCLPFDHWFRIGFDPYHANIILSEDVLGPYKEKQETVWIHIEHNYANLQSHPAGIRVELQFNGLSQIVFIPYEAVTWFEDPTYAFLVKPWETVKISNPSNNLPK